MARSVGYAISPKPGQSSVQDVPEDVKTEIDGLFDWLTANPGHEGRVTGFEDDKERNLWLRQVRAYCPSREAGALKFRQLPSKNLPDGEIRFSLTRDIPQDGENNAKPGPVAEAPKPGPKSSK
jgi:hypothetical protein